MVIETNRAVDVKIKYRSGYWAPNSVTFNYYGKQRIEVPSVHSHVFQLATLLVAALHACQIHTLTVAGVTQLLRVPADWDALPIGTNNVLH